MRQDNPLWVWAQNARSNAHHRAKKKQIPFDLTTRDIIELYPLDGKCPALGRLFVSGIGNGSGPGPYSPTLDRILPERGYVRGNIVVVSLRANTIHLDATAAEVCRVADWLAQEEAKRL